MKLSTSIRSAPADPFEDTHRASALKGAALRGGGVTIVSQLIRFSLQFGANAILARLVTPADFGLVAMVVSVTGLFNVVRDAGLTTATIQRDRITHGEVSTMFWLNLALGAGLTVLTAALSSALATFYREPAVFGVAIALSPAFVLGAVGLQHQALLARQMRFASLAIVDILSALLGILTAIGLAWLGCGYWALVGLSLVTAAATSLGLWIMLPWRPGAPSNSKGVLSMLRFGGYLTASSVLHFLFRNMDNVLIGRYWGSVALGFYSRAYGLLLLPINQVNAPISSVAISALSRLQSEPERLRRFFVGAYSIAVSITLPLVVAVTIFADEVVLFVLGAQWGTAVELFRLLAPAAFIGALLNPLGCLLTSAGRADRQFRLSCFWSGLQILAFVLGLPFGPEGVAMGYSFMSCALALPVCLYVLRSSPVRILDLLKAVESPVFALLIAGIVGVVLKFSLPTSDPIGLRAFWGCSAVLGVYALVLLGVMNKWGVYRDLVRQSLFDK